MTQREFEERTGLQLTAQEYVEVENTYMAIGDDIDKDMFCKIWMNKGELARLMTSRVIEYKSQKEQIKKRYSDLEKEYYNLLLDYDEKLHAESIRKIAIRRMGMREYLRRKLKKGYSLSDEDLKALVDMFLNSYPAL